MTGSVPVPEGADVSRAERATRSSATFALSAIALKRALALANEAAFLWGSRSFVARSSAVTFDALASVDGRLSKFVSALSKKPGLAEPFLQDEHARFKSGHAFVTAAVALRTGASEVFGELVTRLESDAELLSPLASALAWLAYDDVRGYLDWLLASSAPSAVRLGIVAAVAHQVGPKATLARALDSEDALLRSSALEAVSRLGVRDFASRLLAALDDEDVTCRFWGAWGAVRFGDGSGIPVLGRFAADCGVFAKPACDIVLRALEPERSLRAHARLLSMTSNKRLSVLAAGIVGEPTLADWLLKQLNSQSLARPAAAAFCLMTGRDLRRDDLDAEHSPGQTMPQVVLPGTSGNDEAAAQASPDVADDSLADEVDDDLAWPDATRLREWWDRNRHAFVPGVRYLAGGPIRPAELMNVLRSGNQQQRAAAALELALLNPDAPLVDVTAAAHRQAGTNNQLL